MRGPVFENPSRQPFHDFRKIMNSEEKLSQHTFSSFGAILSYNKSSLVKSEISGMLANTLTVDDEYFRDSRDDLALPSQHER